jgi:rubrerythrin
MGWFDLPFSLSVAEQEAIHRECRECGANVENDVTDCPTCGGDITEYLL